MRTNSVLDPRPRLTLRWRRTLVIAGTGGALLLLLLPRIGVIAPRLLPGLTIALGCGLLLCLWLLADTLRPWLGDGSSTPGEQAHADTAVRRSYAVLLWLSVAAMVGLPLLDTRLAAASGALLPAERLLWFFLVAVVGLPVALSAWSDPDEVGGRELGPGALVVARFRSREAPLHYATAATLLYAAALLAVMGGVFGEVRSFGLKVGVVAGLVVVALAGIVAGRSALPRHSGRPDGSKGAGR